MKILFIILCLGIVTGYTDPDQERLKTFINKLERLKNRQNEATYKWPMPSYSPSIHDPMPQTNVNKVDEETGLEYSVHKNLILDRSLQFELNLASGVVSDLKTGKKFSYFELIEEKTNKKNNSKL
jgi:hypothetical protein